MRRLAVTAALILAPALALAGDHAEIHIAFPTPPTLAEIQPGVQVVVDHDQEVFYAGHHYWHRRDGDWYRASHHGDAFTYVESRSVPSALAQLTPGQYRHFHPAHGHGHAYGDGHGLNGNGSCGGGQMHGGN